MQAGPGQDSCGLVIWARPWLNHTPAVAVIGLARPLRRLLEVEVEVEVEVGITKSILAPSPLPSCKG